MDLLKRSKIHQEMYPNRFIKEVVMKNENKNAQIRIVPPPLIFFALFFFGIILHFFIPSTIKIQSAFVRIFVGLTTIGCSGIIALQSFKIMRRYETDITFKRPTTTLIVEGPFRFTRNPLYVSLLLLYAGIGVLINSLWFVPLFFILFIYLRKVIQREERCLEDTYAEEFLKFKNSVRRWL